jgi:hypothetical protein
MAQTEENTTRYLSSSGTGRRWRVADQGVGDAAGAVGQCAGDDAAMFAAGFQSGGMGFGGRFGEPQADTEIA